MPSYLDLTAVITFGVIFHGDAIEPNVCFFVQYSYQQETKNMDLTIIINTTLSDIYQQFPWLKEKRKKT